MSAAPSPVPATPPAPLPMQPGARAHALRRRLQWTALAVLVADLAVAAWLLSPQAPSIGAAQQQQFTARADLARLQRQARDLQLLQGRVHLSREQMQELSAQGLPEDAEAYKKLLAEINRLALGAHAGVTQVAFKRDPKPAYGLLGIAMDMQVSGAYVEIVRFINAMERSPMFFIVNQVSVTSGAQRDSDQANPAGPAPVKLDVKVTAYVRTGEAGKTP